VPADLALDTPILIDEIRIEDADSAISIPVQMTVVELPPYLVASPVIFPPFVKGDTPPESVLRVYNNGPARWRGTVASNKPWLTVPERVFTCEPDNMIEVFVALNSQAPDALPVGLSHYDDALTVTGGREPVLASVHIDLREAISELHLDTPTLNFGQIDGANPELPTLPVRLINASPSPWNGRVEVCVPWLSLQAPARAFDLQIPGMSIAEFGVSLGDDARWLPPGATSEDRALLIKGKDQELSVQALLALNEWSPALSISPEHITFADDAPRTLTVHNTGSRAWTLQVSAAPWLLVSPAEFALDPGKEQAVEVRRAVGPFTGDLCDPRAIVIAGPGREIGVEVKVAEVVAP
jgi:hypothetical protein